jgi:hypothetical protein
MCFGCFGRWRGDAYTDEAHRLRDKEMYDKIDIYSAVLRETVKLRETGAFTPYQIAAFARYRINQLSNRH